MTENHTPQDTTQATDTTPQDTTAPAPQEDTKTNQEVEDTTTAQDRHVADLEKRLKAANSEAATRRQKQREAEARIEELEGEVERIRQERLEEKLTNFTNRIGIPAARHLFPENLPLEDFTREANRVEDLVEEIINDWLSWDRTEILQDLYYLGNINSDVARSAVGNIDFLAEIGLDTRPDRKTLREAIKVYAGKAPHTGKLSAEYPADGVEFDPANRVMNVFNKR